MCVVLCGVALQRRGRESACSGYDAVGSPNAKSKVSLAALRRISIGIGIGITASGLVRGLDSDLWLGIWEIVLLFGNTRYSKYQYKVLLK